MTGERDRPGVVTLLAQSVVDVLPFGVPLFDQTLAGSESRAWIELRDELAERAERWTFGGGRCTAA